MHATNKAYCWKMKSVNRKMTSHRERTILGIERREWIIPVTNPTLDKIRIILHNRVVGRAARKNVRHGDTILKFSS